MAMRLLSTIISGGEKAQQFAAQLVDLSIWFSCDPLPDDEYEFSYKPEAAAGVIAAVRVVEAWR